MVQNFIDFSFHKTFIHTQYWRQCRTVQTEHLVSLFYPQDSCEKLYFCQQSYSDYLNACAVLVYYVFLDSSNDISIMLLSV